MAIVVYPSGPMRPAAYIIGERPGREEALAFRNYGYSEPTPFIGMSGQDMEDFIGRNGLKRRDCRVANVCWDYVEGNADPAPADIERWRADLASDIAKCKPRFVITAGRFAARWCLGPDVNMEAVHGAAQRPSSDSLPSSVEAVIPCYHPAYGIYDPDAKSLVYFDFKRAAEYTTGARPLSFAEDNRPYPSYIDTASVRQLSAEFEWLPDEAEVEIAIDTEGTPTAPWAFQFSMNAGTGLVLRVGHPMFEAMVGCFNHHMARLRPTFILHNGMYDIAMCRAIGVDLIQFPLVDTMMAAYLLRTEPQSLKNLARRHCGMLMSEYSEVIGDAADDKQIDYLLAVANGKWLEPESRLIQENDLTHRAYRPQPVGRRASSILSDWESAINNRNAGIGFRVKPFDKDDFDPVKRWKAVDSELRAMVEAELGPFPHATLADIGLSDAVYYSGRDPDATLRVWHALEPLIAAAGLTNRLALAMKVMVAAEEMQSTGMLADRAAFESLSAAMNDKMETLCRRLSVGFNGGQPINPNSQDQVARLMAERGLRGAKRSRITKKVSTSKKSIEHLRHKDDAMALVADWREHQKIRDSFSDPIAARIPAGARYWPIRANIKLTRVSSSRPAATDPPLLAIPVRHELGVAVRKCFVAPRAHMAEYWQAVGHEPADCMLGTWDLSQIEMRVMAHLSGDELLIKLFREGRDIHAETAIRIFGLNVKGEQDASGKWIYPGVKKKEQRDPTKRAGFGVITGIQGNGLYDQLRMMGCEGWNESKCDDLIKDWFKVYRGVDAYIKDARMRCRRHGYVQDLGGHYRHLPGIWSRDDRARAEAERQSHSHEIQGTAAWMIQRAMAWLWSQVAELRQATDWYIRWLLWVHDELLFCFPEEASDLMHSMVMEALTQHSFKLTVPIDANGVKALSWGELEK